MAAVTLARNAMATRFEILLHGDNPVALRAAGEEALAEIDRLEAELSLFRPTSQIAHLNAHAAKAPVQVTAEVFSLLQWAARLTIETGGAFDVTIGPLLACWGFLGGHGHMASPEELAEARARTGLNLVHLDPEHRTVSFTRPGVIIDLGAIGKGYAIERAAEVLREAGVRSALLHGGTSTMYAIGKPPDQEFWKVAIDRPPSADSTLPPALATVALRDEAMSVSAVWGKQFEKDGVSFGHVLDPRTGLPARQAVLAAVVLPSATETDAISTALLTLGPEAYDQASNLRSGMRSLLAFPCKTGLSLKSTGIDARWGQMPV